MLKDGLQSIHNLELLPPTKIENKRLKVALEQR